MDQFDLDFSSLTPLSLPVAYGGKTYELREADGEASIAYQTALMKATVFVDGKPSSFNEHIAGLAPLLVQKCLYDSDGKRVSMAFVNSLPGRVLGKLFTAAKQLSELESSQTEDQSKNVL